ncbi:DMT family transporter [Rhizobium sp. 007]|uniref:DMT family transporter n=1 Tax=Rhizobium sp. 007 TaxID=2785056 RepID=UPI00188F9E3D|nr:DMT family transporter [Rhizobium sp. 007]QPB24518.1 DMT family transporter [Rhizobium sp. 007]
MVFETTVAGGLLAYGAVDASALAVFDETLEGSAAALAPDGRIAEFRMRQNAETFRRAGMSLYKTINLFRVSQATAADILDPALDQVAQHPAAYTEQVLGSLVDQGKLNLSAMHMTDCVRSRPTTRATFARPNACSLRRRLSMQRPGARRFYKSGRRNVDMRWRLTDHLDSSVAAPTRGRSSDTDKSGKSVDGVAGIIYGATVPALVIIELSATLYLLLAMVVALLFAGAPRLSFANAGTNMSVLPALVSAVSGAMAILCVKGLATELDALSIVTHFVAVVALLSLPLAIWFWRTPPIQALPILLSLGVASALSHIYVTYALRSADVSFIAPFDFLQLIYAAVFGFVLFGEVGTATLGPVLSLSARLPYVTADEASANSGHRLAGAPKMNLEPAGWKL